VGVLGGCRRTRATGATSSGATTAAPETPRRRPRPRRWRCRCCHRRRGRCGSGRCFCHHNRHLRRRRCCYRGSAVARGGVAVSPPSRGSRDTLAHTRRGGRRCARAGYLPRVTGGVARDRLCGGGYEYTPQGGGGGADGDSGRSADILLHRLTPMLNWMHAVAPPACELCVSGGAACVRNWNPVEC
jgi:hypothetical protein